nr:vegetative cell wall protein gp1-like [Penaeus vannamei]
MSLLVTVFLYPYKGSAMSLQWSPVGLRRMVIGLRQEVLTLTNSPHKSQCTSDVDSEASPRRWPSRQKPPPSASEPQTPAGGVPTTPCHSLAQAVSATGKAGVESRPAPPTPDPRLFSGPPPRYPPGRPRPSPRPSIPASLRSSQGLGIRERSSGVE